ncbi:hypothetical protein SAMN05421852_10221 [Thermoflavimicrobium dichotomicum]|uniref:Uncharacterized protein n=1 Tax=Thermoflavimicrobium dichotomicum TaxID=46223 RepID=A0A1I3L3C2_9BACL|nr:hypothetical protein SAMN05421852_10221 [Thermoflavimicrobium dichotomicum]
MSLSVGMLGAVGGWLSQYSIRLPFLGMALICIPCLLLCYLFMKREERLKFNKHVYHDPGVKRKRKTVI